MNILWAFASVGLSVADDGLHGSQMVSKINPEYNEKDASRIMTVSHRLADTLSQQLFSDLCGLDSVTAVDSRRFCTKLTNHNLSLVVWSLSILGQNVVPEHFDAFLKHAFEVIDWADTSAEVNNLDRSQIYQVYMMQLSPWKGRSILARRKSLGIPSKCSYIFPPSSLEACKRTYTELSRSNLLVQSKFHSDVARILKGLGVETDMEHVTEEGFVIDLAIPKMRIAIEVNGPSHFVTCVDLKGSGPKCFAQRRTLDGASRMKHALLSGLGWNVISISHFEWELLKGNHEHSLFVQSLLQDYSF